MTERLDMERDSWVRWENSFGGSQPEKRTMKITAWVCADRGRGGFEIYDTESGGEMYYGEGGMWLGDDGFINDYDGVFSLDKDIILWLDDLGMVAPNGWFRKEIEKIKKEE